MNDGHIPNMLEIEERARALRAQAMRDMWSALVSAIRSAPVAQARRA